MMVELRIQWAAGRMKQSRLGHSSGVQYRMPSLRQ